MRRHLNEFPAILPAAALLACIYGWAVFVSTFVWPGVIGPNYIAPGTDWMVMYGAVDAALHGHIPLIYDGDRFTAHLNTMFSGWLTQPLYFRPWVYPPSFLVILVPLAPLGFFGSYVVFQVISAGLLALALQYRAESRIAAPWIALTACVSPAASLNVVDGQCSFLVAALIVGAFRLALVRPLLAGVLVGLLTFKPQFGLLIPIALIAMRQWRMIASAIATAVILFVLSAAIFGLDAWRMWIDAAAQGYFSGDFEWVQFDRMWGSSIYTCAVLLGAGRYASLLQSFAIVAAAFVTWVVFTSRLRSDLKLAALLVATLIAAPHWAGYDAILLVIAAGIWLAGEPRPWPFWKAFVALALWILPFITPPVLVPVGRLIPLLLAAVLWIFVDTARSNEIPAQRAV